MRSSSWRRRVRRRSSISSSEERRRWPSRASSRVLDEPVGVAARPLRRAGADRLRLPRRDGRLARRTQRQRLAVGPARSRPRNRRRLRRRRRQGPGNGCAAGSPRSSATPTRRRLQRRAAWPTPISPLPIRLSCATLRGDRRAFGDLAIPTRGEEGAWAIGDLCHRASAAAAASALLVAAASPALAEPNCWTDVTPNECPNGGWHVLQFKNSCSGGEKTINLCLKWTSGDVVGGRHPLRQFRQRRRDGGIPSRPLRQRRRQLQLPLRRQRAGLSDAIAAAVGQREISERASSAALAGFSPMRRMA